MITPNPKTSGAARWNYLGAWGYALLKSNRDEAKAKILSPSSIRTCRCSIPAARGATTTFVQRGIGDVLINWENEILLSGRELGPDKFDIVVPPSSILAEPTVAVVEKVADKHGTIEAARAYLEYLYTKEGQEIVANTSTGRWMRRSRPNTPPSSRS